VRGCDSILRLREWIRSWTGGTPTRVRPPANGGPGAFGWWRFLAERLYKAVRWMAIEIHNPSPRLRGEAGVNVVHPDLTPVACVHHSSCASLLGPLAHTRSLSASGSVSLMNAPRTGFAARRYFNLSAVR
jgi:hypothetical protein